jgi:MFS family permease
VKQYLRVLRFPNFRALFLGQSASNVGDQVVIVALALYVTERTGSAADLGFVLAAQALPLIGLILLGGVWADRFGGPGRRRIMIGADSARAILHATLAVLILTGGASVVQLIVIEALFGAARAFFNPAYTGLIPQTVPDDHVQEAQALTGLSVNLSIMVGPAIGTALMLTVGAGAAFALDAATFVVSAVLLTRVHPRARGAERTTETVVQSLRAGFSEVRSRPWVWATIIAFCVAVLFSYAQWYSLAPSIAKEFYGGADKFGVLESIAGVGAVLGALIGIKWRPKRPLMLGLALVLAWPLQDLAFATLQPFVTVVLLAFSVGLTFALFEIWWETALVRHIPADSLSRVSSYDWMGSLALLPLGFAIAGPIASAVGARTVLGVGAGVTFVTLLAAMTPRSTRELSLTEQVADDVVVEAGGEAEVADVDPLIGVMHQRVALQEPLMPHREEPVGDAVGKGVTEVLAVGEGGQDQRDG